jgi:hypothetical protein
MGVQPGSSAGAGNPFRMKYIPLANIIRIWETNNIPTENNS